MASSQPRGMDTRLHGLVTENASLVQDVDNMQDMLSYHYQNTSAGSTGTVKGMLRKEIGGSIWQHGGEGKVSKYKSSRDLQDRYGLQSDKMSVTPPKMATGIAPAAKPKAKYCNGSRAIKPSVIGGHSKPSSAKCRNHSAKASSSQKVQGDIESPSLTIRGHAGNPTEIQHIDDTFIIESISMATSQGQDEPAHDNVDDNNMPSDFGTKTKDSAASASRKKALEKMLKKMDYENDLQKYRQPGNDLESDCVQISGQSRPSGQSRRSGQSQPSDADKSCMKRTGICQPEVKRWLTSLNLLNTEACITVFARHSIEMDMVPFLTKEKLREMNVKNAGVQNKIMGGVQKLVRQKQMKSRTASGRSKPSRANVTTPKEQSMQAAAIEVHIPSQGYTPTTSHCVDELESSLVTNGACVHGTKSKQQQQQQSSVLLKRNITVSPAALKQRSSAVSTAAARPTSAREPLRGKGQIPGESRSPRPGSASVTLTGNNRKSVHVPILTGSKMKRTSPRVGEHTTSEVNSEGSSARSGQGSARSQRSSARSPRSVRESCPSPDDDLTDLLYVKTLHQMAPFDEADTSDLHAVANETVEYDKVSGELTDITQLATETSHTSEAAPDVAERKLLEVEMQMQSLQENLSNPEALHMVQNLQIQLKAIQTQIVKEKKKAKKSTVETSLSETAENKAVPPETMPHKLSTNQTALEQEYPTNQMPDGNDTNAEPTVQSSPVLTKMPPPPRPQTAAAGGRPLPAPVPAVRASSAGFTSPQKQAGVVSMSMSKTELLREVRKQKDQHRKEIRHLESELSRLKHKDPLRTFEIPETDIMVDEESALLGEGAFSKVFHGSYQSSDVAVKRLKVPLSAQDKNYFTAEVSLLQGLRHPRVVLLLGVCTTSHLPIMVLEYMARGSLYHYLHDPDRLNLDHAEFYQIARDMALGMNYLHLHRPPVLHLDLKSMNVLLTTHMRAKIADFGFSKLRLEADMTSNTQQGQGQGHTKGTPAWMAPELLSGGNVSTKCDVYSFAVVLWEMLTRQHPYEGCSVFQVLERVRQQKRPEIPEESCPVELQQLIAHCWDNNPSKRPHFKNILQSLDTLHFPAEWRSLFDAAGIPRAALDDIESTRTLINIVTQTIEQGSTTGEDIVEPLPPSVPNSMENVVAAVNIPRLRLYSSGSEDDHKVFAHSKGTASKPEITHISLAWSEDFAENSARTVHPSVPPLRMSLLDEDAPREEPDPEMLKPVSFAEELKLGAMNLKPKVHQKTEAVTGEPQKAKVSVSQKTEIRASQLLRQKQQLRPTLQPHPNQLQDLSDVSRDQIDSLAALLRKAVNDRRLALQAKEEDQSTDDIQNTNDSGWSVSQD